MLEKQELKREKEQNVDIIIKNILDEIYNPVITLELIKEIDKPIRDFIIELNKIEGVITISSCSGHSYPIKRSFYRSTIVYGRLAERLNANTTEVYISFKYTMDENLDKVLNFFRKEGFTVEEDYPIDSIVMPHQRWWSVRTRLVLISTL